MKKILFVLVIVLVLVLASACQKSVPVDYEQKYIELEKQYNRLESRYDELSNAVWKVETDVYCLYYYFDGSSEFSKKEAHDSAVELYDVLSPIYHK